MKHLGLKKILAICICSFLSLITMLSVFLHSQELSKNIDFNSVINVENTTDVDTPTIITVDARNIHLGDVIAIHTFNQEMEIVNDDEFIYEYKKDFSDAYGKSAVSKWHIIALPHGESNLNLEIFLEIPYSQGFEYENEVMIGNVETIIEYIVIRSVPALAISVISILSGILIFLWFIFLEYKKEYNKIFSFAIFLIFIGFWSIGLSQRVFYELFPLHISVVIYRYSFYIMPIPLFLAATFHYNGILKKVYSILTAISVVNFITIVILQLLGIFDMYEWVFTVTILAILGIATIICLKIYKLVVLKENMNKMYIWNLVFAIIILALEIVSYYKGNLTTISLYIRVWLVTFALSYLISMWTNYVKRNNELKDMNEKLDISRQSLLASKMHPHLINNTLTSIQDLCYTDPSSAVDAIGTFSKYLKSSFSYDVIQTSVPFINEVSYIRDYVAIQKLCYGDEVSYIEKIEYTNFQIPPLTIQPLVENAFKHGIRRRVGKGRVSLNVFRDGNSVIIKITDNGVGFDIKNNQSYKKTSTKSVEFRLKKISKALIFVDSEIDIGTIVTVVIPIKGVD